jgi:hypothetical protein
LVHQDLVERKVRVDLEPQNLVKIKYKLYERRFKND